MRDVIHFSIGKSSLGSILVATSAKRICAITIGTDAKILLQDLQRRFPKAKLLKGDTECSKTTAAVIRFAEKPTSRFSIPLEMHGTAFQQQVWRALQKIPLGKTSSYAAIAKSIGKPRAVRAVAQACGANSIAIAIPCHRVIRTDGSLSGYRWGIERKAALLEREQQ